MVRWLVLFLTACSFRPQLGAEDARRIDAPRIDASGGRDAPGDGVVAMPDAATPDAAKPAGVSYVQSASGVGGSNQVALQLAQPIAIGDLCVIGVGIDGNSIASVTDSGANTFTAISTNGGQTVYVAAGMHASASDRITVSFTGITGYTAAAAVYRGLATASPVEASSAASGAGVAIDSGAAATMHPHDLLVGVVASNGNMAAGSGFTARVGGTYSMIEDREVTVANGYHATATASQAEAWAMCELALKAAD